MELDVRTPPPTWRRWLPAALLVIVASAACVVSWLGSYDDAYITYAFAKNLAAGNGWTWGGVKVLGTSSPIFAVLLAGLSLVTPLSIPVWGHLISYLAVLAAALSLLYLGRREGWPRAAFAAGALWVLAPLLFWTAGSEYLPGIACVTGALVALEKQRWAWAGVALAAAVALRPELGLAALAIAALTVNRLGLRQGGPLVARTALVALALWGGWLLALTVWAGSPMPTTLAAKQAQGASPYWSSGLRVVQQAVDHARSVFFPHTFNLILAGAAAGLVRTALSLRRWRDVATIALWGAAHLLAVAALRIPYYHWYGLPAGFALVVLLAAVIEPPPLRRRAGIVWTVVTSVLLVAALLVDIVPVAERVARDPRDLRDTRYTECARWINQHYPASTTVGAFEVGYLGYYGEFRTIDYLGLVNPAVPPAAIRDGKIASLWQARRPDLLMWPPHTAGFINALVGNTRRFVADYKLEALWPHPVMPIMLYRRADLPPRGEVLRDLTGALGDEAGGVTFVFRGGIGAPAITVPAGASVTWPETEPDCFFFAGVAGSERGEARVVVTAGEGDTSQSWTFVGQPNVWTPVSLRLTTPAAAPLRLTCQAGSASGCFVAIPNLHRLP